jgi:hypothetical protein|nr:MAG TPA: Protein of unknown function (DUF1642) [Caudoviricetes sp.]
MNKKELIKHIEDLPYKEGPIVDKIYISRNGLLKLIEQLDEPEKVKVPQFVADWIEVAKTVYSLSGGMTYGGPGVNKWLENEDNQRTFVLAWFDGYMVENEKRYLVKIKGICGNHETLNREKHSNKWLFSDREENSLYGTHHTRKELEDAGFGWVFDCEGIEIEEVEE